MARPCYVYCIVPADHAPRAVAGIGGADIRMVSAGDIALWVSDAAVRPAARIDEIEAHNDVVAGAMTQDVTPIPLRYGHWFADEAVARAALLEEGARWRRLLERFAGAAEWGLRVMDPDGAARVVRAPASGGTDYLRGRAAARSQTTLDSRGESALRLVRARLDPLRRDEVVRAPATPRGVVDIAHLVDHQHVPAYVAGVEALHTDEPGVRFLSSGPWPPYSFVP